MHHRLVAPLLALSLTASLGGCYAEARGPAKEKIPQSGLWHLEFQGDGSESANYHVAFHANGDVIVYDGELRHDVDGTSITTDTSPTQHNSLYKEPNHWGREVVVLHTLREFGRAGIMAAHEYTFKVQDAHTLVGQVVSTVRTNGIYTRGTYKAKASFISPDAPDSRYR